MSLWVEAGQQKRRPEERAKEGILRLREKNSLLASLHLLSTNWRTNCAVSPHPTWPVWLPKRRPQNGGKNNRFGQLEQEAAG